MIIKYKKFLLFLISSFVFFNFIYDVNASNNWQEKIMYGNDCPQQTTVGVDNIIFVGKAALGGDVAVHTWFEWGTSSNNLSNKTQIVTLNKEDFFCVQVFGLNKCSLYYYRAAAKNTAGVNYGDIKSKQTLCGNNKQNSTTTIKNNLQRKADSNVVSSKKVNRIKKYKNLNKNKSTNNFINTKTINKDKQIKNIRKNSDWFIF